MQQTRTWAEIDLSALRHNLSHAHNHSGKAVMGVIKADAYGHGLIRFARALEKENLPFFGVAHTQEARRLTEAGLNTQIYLLSATLPDERAEIAANPWTPCLCTLDEIAHFGRLSQEKPLTAHLAIDTGMGRGGFLPNQIAEALQALKKHPQLTLGGIGSHLPAADEDPEFTKEQFLLFDRLVRDILATPDLKIVENPWIHLANSAGLLGYCSETSNLIRPGLLLYGLSPIPEFQKYLRPVMTLKTRVSLINTLPAGHGVSYGRTILQKETRIAILGIGYGDGYPRALSDTGTHVLIRDTPCPLLGRVTMDQIIVDITHLPECETGDHAILFGQELLITDLATRAKTIAWEILTQLTPRVERHYINERAADSPTER